jgi:hypothetical protein
MGKKRRLIHRTNKFAAKYANHPITITTITPVATTPVVEEVVETPVVEEVVETPAAATEVTPKPATKKKKSTWSRK